MMYINFSVFEECDISWSDLRILLAVKDGLTFLQYSNYPDNSLQIPNLCDLGYLKDIKGLRGEEYYKKIRLTKKAKQLLEDISTPEVEKEDLAIFNKLCDWYLDSEDEERVIGNRKKTAMYVAQFRRHCGISVKQMAWLCYYFLQEYKYTKKLENIFFDSNKNRYGKFINNIEDSPLYQFMWERDEDIQKIWKTKITAE